MSIQTMGDAAADADAADDDECSEWATVNGGDRGGRAAYRRAAERVEPEVGVASTASPDSSTSLGWSAEWQGAGALSSSKGTLCRSNRLLSFARDRGARKSGRAASM
eukprot:5716018-Prymnesium_polylepis.2